MTFAEEVGAYRFRLLGPRFRAGNDGRYRLPRAERGPATVLESPQLVLETNNVALGPVESRLKAPLRELSAISSTSTLACGAVVNAAVRHMPDELAFVSLGVGNGFMFLAGMLGNDRRHCVGIDDFGADARSREVFRARFDARRSPRHAFHDGEYRDYLGGADGFGIGVLLLSAGSYDQQLDGLRAAEPRLADDCVVIAEVGDRGEARRATLDFPHESRLPWRLVLDERTSGAHPTLGDGLVVLQAGGDAPLAPLELATETRLSDPVEVPQLVPSHPPLVTVLHYRNPWVGAQDYPNLEVVGLNRDRTLTEAFEASTGDYIVVLDPDVELTPDAIGEAVRQAESASPADSSAARRLWSSVARREPRRNGGGSRRHRPLAQAEYFPSWSRAFDDADEPQTVTVARALSVSRDNLVVLDLDPRLEDPDREIAVRFARGLRLEGPAAQCSRVPSGVVAGRAGVALTPDGRWLIESVGAVARAWPALALDDHGEVELTEAPRESDDRVATIVCELRRDWWTARYGHWTFDVLTRVAMLLRAGAPGDVKLLVPEPVVPWQRRTLAGLGIAKERIVPWDGKPTRFREVYVPTARAAPPFVFPAGIELLREFGAGAREAAPSRRLFVSRRQLGLTTRIANEDELLDVATGLDFVEVMPETLPYAEQLRLFAEAEVVVGAHGSGLANAVHMARGTGLCELAPARLHAEKVPNFWNLAACGRQRYGVCVAGNRRIDPKRFRRVLREIILATARERASIEPVAEGVTQPA